MGDLLTALFPADVLANDRARAALMLIGDALDALIRLGGQGSKP